MARLSCLIGLHRPVLPGTWSLGYCFSTCRGCGRDMVRSVLDDEWHAPKKVRVVRGGVEMYDGLDAQLREREKPRPPIRIPLPRPKPKAKPAVDAPGGEAASGWSFFAPPPAKPKVPPAAPAAGESPFDFSDFEGEVADFPPLPPLKNAQNG